MKKVKIYIDTSDNKRTMVCLTTESIEDWIEETITVHRDQLVLEFISKLLKKHNLTLNDLTEIAVNPGPGSFTGVRVGVSIANALSFALGIPVNNKSGKELVEPSYL